jgi:hypothetical protein
MMLCVKMRLTPSCPAKSQLQCRVTIVRVDYTEAILGIIIEMV